MSDLSPEDREALIRLSRSAIRAQLQTGAPVEKPPAPGPALLEKRGCFVTLHRDGRLRGCIGVIEPTRSLMSEVEIHACHAAFRDPRFSPLTLSELASVKIEVSVLTVPEPLVFEGSEDLLEKLIAGKHGVILSQEGLPGDVFAPGLGTASGQSVFSYPPVPQSRPSRFVLETVQYPDRGLRGRILFRVILIPPRPAGGVSPAETTCCFLSRRRLARADTTCFLGRDCARNSPGGGSRMALHIAGTIRGAVAIPTMSGCIPLGGFAGDRGIGCWRTDLGSTCGRQVALPVAKD